MTGIAFDVQAAKKRSIADMIPVSANNPQVGVRYLDGVAYPWSAEQRARDMGYASASAYNAAQGSAPVTHQAAMPRKSVSSPLDGGLYYIAAEPLGPRMTTKTLYDVMWRARADAARLDEASALHFKEGKSSADSRRAYAERKELKGSKSAPPAVEEKPTPPRDIPGSRDELREHSGSDAAVVQRDVRETQESHVAPAAVARDEESPIVGYAIIGAAIASIALLLITIRRR